MLFLHPQFDPARGMIVRMLAAAHLAVDPGRYEAAGDRWAQQQAIDGQSGGVAERVPENISGTRRSARSRRRQRRRGDRDDNNDAGKSTGFSYPT